MKPGYYSDEPFFTPKFAKGLLKDGVTEYKSAQYNKYELEVGLSNGTYFKYSTYHLLYDWQASLYSYYNEWTYTDYVYSNYTNSTNGTTKNDTYEVQSYYPYYPVVIDYDFFPYKNHIFKVMVTPDYHVVFTNGTDELVLTPNST